MAIRVVKVAAGIHWVEIPEADLRILCGCPADSVKHLMKRGLIIATEEAGTVFETGPNAILLSDVSLQNGEFSNLAEFPILQMLYRQGMILPGHPNNSGVKPLLIGLTEQIASQLDYIYRGNYGLVSQTELEDAGVSPAQAQEWMRVKLRFAFGEIRTSENLVDSCPVGDGAQLIRNGVSIRRLDLNIYEISHGEESVLVNLNLNPSEVYAPPYPLNYHNLRREYFAIVHSGEGDGWDANRPTMSSVLMFQGKIYLVDAGPNLQTVLKALGIGINEIEGIFHTHSHDDHFCGLTTLIRTDRRIRYFATPPVRVAVTKKLAALMSISERDFEHYFDICDLHLDCWNDVEGLQVRPVYSPHPVETTLFTFRAQTEGGDRSYAHFADIVSFGVLAQMTTTDPAASGIAPEAAEKVRRDYLVPADLKKIDVGGGLIHGTADDFENDSSRKIILAHTAADLTNAQRRIGSGAPFGTVDVLIPSARDYTLRKAHSYLTAYFPDVAQHELEMLLNRPIIDINAETILLREGEKCEFVTMPLTGLMEVINAENDSRYILPAGTLIGETASLYDMPAAKTYRAASFVKAIAWPAELYRAFIAKNDQMDMARSTSAMRSIFARSWLFGENLSIPVMNALARASSSLVPDSGSELSQGADSLYFVYRGRLEWQVGEKALEVIEPGGFFGEDMVLFGSTAVGRVLVRGACELFTVSGALLREIPIVRWKLFETHQRRMRQLLAPGGDGLAFPWSSDYAVGIREVDDHHRRMFDMANAVMAAIDRNDLASAGAGLCSLIDFTSFHFGEEIKLLASVGYPDAKDHHRIHKKHGDELMAIKKTIESGDLKNAPLNRADFRLFFRSFVVDHVFKQDKQFGRFIYDKKNLVV
ncbi:MAG TPA: MBL fold metallo-hydrolase [Rhodospirillaceae bacterium]|nr:MBL fold metallo-hydrolase [Rhodospirillaceae bacterium]